MLSSSNNGAQVHPVSPSSSQQVPQQISQSYEYSYGVSAPPPQELVKQEEKLYSEDDEFTPTVPLLILLGFAVAAVAAGIGVGIYYANENLGRNKGDGSTEMPSSMPTSSPSAAPTAMPSIRPTNAPFDCNICGADRSITLPDVVITIEGINVTTCASLEELGVTGNFGREDCIQLFQTDELQETCGCEDDDDNDFLNSTTTVPTMAPTNSTTNDNNTTQPPTEEEEEAPVFVCPICGGEDFGISNFNATIMVPNNPTNQTLTCGGLQATAERGQIDPNTCFSGPLVAAVQEACDCVFQCNICGSMGDDGDDPVAGSVTNPDGVVEFPGGQPSRTCSQLEASAMAGNITEEQCGLLAQFVVEPCACEFFSSSNIVI